MRKVACLLLLLAAVCGVAQDRHDYPKAEFYGAFSFASLQSSYRDSAIGGFAGLGASPRPWLRLVMEGAALYRNTDFTYAGKTARLKAYEVLVGPEYTKRLPKATPFVHTLFGLAANHYTTPSGDPQHPDDVLAVEYGPAFAFGGGVDVNLSHRWAVRVFQADLILTRLHSDHPEWSPLKTQLQTISGWQTSARLGFGVVVRFGY